MGNTHWKDKKTAFGMDIPKEVHQTQEHFRNKERSQYRKDARNGRSLYSNLDTPEMTGEEMMTDREAVSVEDTVELILLCEQVRKAVDRLPEAQKKLIQSLFFEGKTEEDVAAELGVSQQAVSQQAVSKRVHWALAKMKKFLKN